MLAVEDYIYALEWAETLGGLSGLIARSEAHAAALDRWVRATDWIDHLAVDPASRTTTSVCLKFAHPAGDGPDEDTQLAPVTTMTLQIGRHSMRVSVEQHVIILREV